MSYMSCVSVVDIETVRRSLREFLMDLFGGAEPNVNVLLNTSYTALVLHALLTSRRSIAGKT